MRKTSVNISSNVFDLISERITEYSVDKLLLSAQLNDPKVTKMRLTQIVSDMVINGEIPPVFINPIKGCYEEFPIELKQELLLFKDPILFAKKYRNMKKLLSYRAKNSIESETGTIEVKPQEAELKHIPKKSFFKRLFSKK